MATPLPGIHHVTAISGNPQRNLDFYAGLLGLRLVKLTVNFDDPGTYHLYYGDGLGTPGTILTFFPWPGAPRGRPGAGQVTTTSFSIIPEAMPYWIERLSRAAIALSGPVRRFDEEVLSFPDPDGLALELVARSGVEQREGWSDGPVAPRYALRGFAGVTLTERAGGPTVSLLTEYLGFRHAGEAGSRSRFALGSGPSQALVDVLHIPEASPGHILAGTVHHVAWRTPDDEQQHIWREALARHGVDVTPVRDRRYFRSIYFNEPGGVLFEIATDPPGFTVDEPVALLGTALQLPPFLEGRRAELQRILPPLRLPWPQD